MDINLAIYGGAVAVGALALLTAQWAYGEWLWRLDRGSVVMPSFDEALARKSEALEALMALAALRATAAQDEGESGLAPDYEGPEVIS